MFMFTHWCFLRLHTVAVPDCWTTQQQIISCGDQCQLDNKMTVSVVQKNPVCVCHLLSHSNRAVTSLALICPSSCIAMETLACRGAWTLITPSHRSVICGHTYIFKSILMSQQCLFVTFPPKSMHVRASFIHLPSVSGGRAPLISVQQRFCLIFVKLDQTWWIKYAGFPSDVLWRLFLVNNSSTCCCSVC